MSKTVLAEVNGWTPIMDNLVKEFGLITAAVFGVVWRHCQMRDGVCTASQERLAEILGMTRASINKHISILVKGNFLEDMTPNKKNRPHIYADTGKALLTVSINSTVHDIDSGSVNGTNSTINDIDASMTNYETRAHSKKRLRCRAPLLISKNSSEFFDIAHKTDTTLNDPNIILIKEVTNLTPPKVVRARIIQVCKEKLGEGGLLDKDRLIRVFTNWCASGYRKTNFNGWFFERYFEDEGYVPDYDTRAMPKS